MTVAIVSDLEAESLPVIDFIAPLPGFPTDRRFLLVRVDDDNLLFAMTSLDNTGLRFLVAPPAPFFPKYAPEIDEETLTSLGTTEASDLLLLLVISAAESAKEATVNLMAPIVVDQRTLRATQLVLLGSELSIREPLLIPRA